MIVDALQNREPFNNGNRLLGGCITAKSATNIYYLTHRTTHSHTETKKILAKLFALFNLLDTAAMDCRRALSNDMKDFEDAVMVQTAIRSGCDCIVTRNIKDYNNASIPFYSPSDFLVYIKPLKE